MSRARRSVPLAAALSVALTGALALPALAAAPPVRDAGAGTTLALPPAGEYPEGIGVFGDRYYVGATSDGTLYSGRVGRDATVLSPGGTDGRTTAIGIKATADRLFVAGGGTGYVFVYDRRSGDLLARYENGGTPSTTFLNDVAVANDGTAYVTDSVSPYLYAIPADGPTDGGTYPLPVAVDLTGTAFRYVDGFNANGIALTPDGRTAYVVQSATGRLFAVDVRTDAVREVSVVDGDGARYALTNGDGLLLQGGRLHVVQNSQELVATLVVRGDRAVLQSLTTDEVLQYPTTAAFAQGRLLLVNSQFDVRSAGGDPVRPFTVASIPVPR